MTWLSNETVERLRDLATRPAVSGDRYVILRPLGRGGMGTVYAARDAVLGRDVALKVSNAAVATGDLEARLQREAQVRARLEHPGIVPVHDAGVLEDGRVFYVMKLVQGETLEQHARTLTSEAARLGVFERIVETVAFAHAAGVVHRDLKPSNVMVGRFGEVLVLDWGVARIVAEQDTARHARIGTVGFMAPEQASGGAAGAGPAADVFALGAVLSWLLSGASIPRRLRAIVSKCTATEPDARYPNAAALAEDLSRYRQGAPVSAYRDTWLESAGAWFVRYRTFILLVLAYLVMRALLAIWTR